MAPESGQVEQVEAPERAWYFPGPQGGHVNEPGALEYVPGGHNLHVAPVADQYCPAGHGCVVPKTTATVVGEVEAVLDVALLLEVLAVDDELDATVGADLVVVVVVVVVVVTVPGQAKP